MSENKFNLPTLIAAILISVILSVAISYSVISPKTGPPGPEGPLGLQGEVGLTGSQGIQGPKGERGEVGPQGEQGSQGSQGIQGIVGEIGEPGPQGSIGLRGPVGFYSMYHAPGEYVEIPGIINGDFSEFDGNNLVGWVTQGKSGYRDEGRCLYQRIGGTFMMQTVVIEKNQGFAFSVKSNGARLEVHVDGFVLFYGDFRNASEEWMRIVVPVGDLYTGIRILYFVVLNGADDGSYVVLDDVTMVEFMS
ncbi:hypothetical protein ES703_86508 [subsurface metagenome]